MTKSGSGLNSRTYTVVTCHFGDPVWIEHLAQKIDQNSDDRLQSLVIVDQDRTNSEWLYELPRVTEVLQFPIAHEQVKILGHDHPAALDRALDSISFSSTHVIVMDSDCFPISNAWLDELPDSMVAGDPYKRGLSHPCFMVFPVELSRELSFSEGTVEVGIDTGRLIGLRIAQRAQSVTFTQSIRAFKGLRGDFYREGRIYHHGSASFISSSDPRLNSQVNATFERWFRERVLNEEFSLNHFQTWLVRFHRGLSRLRRYRS